MKRKAYYVLSTHWDREWYWPFQDYRYRLTRLMDEVLGGIESGELAGPFQTDGQACLVEDYLEARPERRESVRRHAAAGRLAIGPWYTLPDEFLVSGESLIRNLELGRRIARELGGKPSDAGFVCDEFGHTSQLPQIFAGFGIRAGLAWRGTNLTTRLFCWRAPDGTELPFHRFGRDGYGSYAVQVRGAGASSAGVKRDVRAELLKFIENEAQAMPLGPVLLFDGGDHMEWDRASYAVLKSVMNDPACGLEIAHGSLDDYVRDLIPHAAKIQTQLEGELREAGRYPGNEDTQWVIPGVLSSRPWIKRENALCESLLCHWAEPWCIFTRAALGCDWPGGLIDAAWKLLLQNHAHDSICGCSIDVVHQDMAYRFRQTRQIAQRLSDEMVRAVASRVKGELGDDAIRVVVFNPLPRAMDDVVDLEVSIPSDWPAFQEFFGYEPKPAFRILNSDGGEIAYQRLSQSPDRRKVRTPHGKFPRGWRATDVRIAARLSIPAMGYTTLVVRKGEAGKPTRYPVTPSLVTGDRSMENEHLRVSVEAGGTLALLDKRTGQSWSGLLTFEDCADIGDGWYHGQAVNDQVFSSAASHADVAVVHSGPHMASLRIRTAMRVPRAFDFVRMARSTELAELVIDSYVTLRAGAARVEVCSVVHNQITDHRLRVLFPSGCEKAKAYLADAAFDVVERPIALPADAHEYRELPLATRPQRSWTAVRQPGRGLAVVAASLHESGVLDQPQRPIALTLFRATQRTVFTNGEPEGQVQGDLSFDYWIVPDGGRPDVTGLTETGHRMLAGLRAASVMAVDVSADSANQSIAPTGGFMELSGPAVLTSLRPIGDAIEARLFNPTDAPIQATLAFTGPLTPARAQVVDFEHQPVGSPLPASGGKLVVPIGAKQIRTLRLGT